MSNHKHLNPNPIKEIVVGVSLRQLFKSHKDLVMLKEALHERFPLSREATETSISFNAKLEQAPVFDRAVKGIHLTSNDTQDLLRLETQLFETRTKRPYVNFETTLENFLKTFDLVSRSATDMQIGNMVTLEYVNQFLFNYDELNKFFKVIPCISLPPDQFLMNQFTGVYKTSTRTGVIANVVSEILPVTDKLQVSFIISVSKTKPGLEQKEFRGVLSELNQTACDIFFSNLTEEYTQGKVS